jgi:hypothetical protein
MRWSWLIGVAGGAVAGLAAERSGACSCGSPQYSQEPDFWFDDESAGRPFPGPMPIPIDAAPWLLRPCDHPPVPDVCTLESGDLQIPLKVEEFGECDLAASEELYSAPPTVIQRFIPTAPLTPGTWTLNCGDIEDYDDYYSYGLFDGDPKTPPKLQVGDHEAGPPTALGEALKVHYTRSDPDSCCGRPNYLTITIYFAAPHLREGGYIEVVYPSGQVFTIVGPLYDALDGETSLPGSRGPLLFTPVAIDGTRGETVRIDEDDMTEDLIYIPCRSQVDGSPTGGAPWLLAPMAWAWARRRRVAVAT